MTTTSSSVGTSRPEIAPDDFTRYKSCPEYVYGRFNPRGEPLHDPTTLNWSGLLPVPEVGTKVDLGSQFGRALVTGYASHGCWLGLWVMYDNYALSKLHPDGVLVYGSECKPIPVPRY